MRDARRRGRLLAVMVIGLALAGCNSMNLGTGGANADKNARGGPTPQISGVALPEGYSLDADRTIILGEGDRWIGRLSYSINISADAMFDFIRGEMTNQNWKEVAVVRAETSHLTYLSGDGDRVASILIARNTLYGAKVDMTVSPAAGGLAPPSRPAPRR